VRRLKNTSARERFATNLRHARKAKGLSQEALGELADLHPTYVGSVERGERNVSIDNMERLAEALGLDVVDLLDTRYEKTKEDKSVFRDPVRNP
jgi:transcriptional regulator with XRE-family HTH domain